MQSDANTTEWTPLLASAGSSLSRCGPTEAIQYLEAYSYLYDSGCASKPRRKGFTASTAIALVTTSH
jgi:hypothetical protein